MSIINDTYFQFQRSVPVTTPNDQLKLQSYIDKYEKKYLIDALGYELYTEFIAGLSVELPETIEQKWLDLRDGCVFTAVDNVGNIRLLFWNGLANDEKESFLADFTYFHLLKDSANSLGTGAGLYAPEGENAVRTNPRNKLVEVFNNGIETYGKSFECDTIKPTLTTIPTLVNFIYQTNLIAPVAYPNWQFTNQKRLNIFGI